MVVGRNAGFSSESQQRLCRIRRVISVGWRKMKAFRLNKDASNPMQILVKRAGNSWLPKAHKPASVFFPRSFVSASSLSRLGMAKALLMSCRASSFLPI